MDPHPNFSTLTDELLSRFKENVDAEVERRKLTIIESTGVCDASPEFKKRFTTSSPIPKIPWSFAEPPVDETHTLTKEDIQAAIDGYIRDKYPKHEPFTLSLTIKDNPQPVTEPRWVTRMRMATPEETQAIHEAGTVIPLNPNMHVLTPQETEALANPMWKKTVDNAFKDTPSEPPQETPPPRETLPGSSRSLLYALCSDNLGRTLTDLDKEIIEAAFYGYGHDELTPAEIAVFRKMVKNLKAE